MATTDHEKLLVQLKSEAGRRYPANMTLTKLISLIEKESSNLPEKLYIPEYEVNKEYLMEILKEIGYSTTFEEEYNNYFEQFCYIIKLSK